MGKLKTVKYEMYISTDSLRGNLIKLSKKQFEETLNNYMKQVNENIKYYMENPAEEEYNEEPLQEVIPEIKEHPQYIETQYAIFDKGVVILLRKSETKKGYYWK